MTSKSVSRRTPRRVQDHREVGLSYFLKSVAVAWCMSADFTIPLSWPTIRRQACSWIRSLATMVDLSVACQRGIEVETAVRSQRGKNYLSEVRTRFPL